MFFESSLPPGFGAVRGGDFLLDVDAVAVATADDILDVVGAPLAGVAGVGSSKNSGFFTSISPVYEESG